MIDPVSLTRAIAEHYNNQYPSEAYKFVLEAFEYIRLLKRQYPNPPKHITAKQLTEAVVIYSVRQYGQLARTIWEQLSVKTSKDVGTLVEHLVEQQVLGKSDRDKFEDFFDILDITIFDDLELQIGDDNKFTYGVPLTDDKGTINKVFV